MKMPDFKLRIWGSLFFLFLFAYSPLQASSTHLQKANAGPRYDSLRIIVTNWYNTRGCAFGDPAIACAQLDKDQTLIFSMRLRCLTNQIDNIPGMRIRYSLYAETPGGTQINAMTQVFTSGMFRSVVLENGESAYEATVLEWVPLDQECIEDDFYFFSAVYDLVEDIEIPPGVDPATVTYPPYPVGSYPEVFGVETFEIPPSGVYVTENKRKCVCCYAGEDLPLCCDGAYVPEECEEDSNGGGSGGGLLRKTPDELPNQLVANPNPFGAELVAQYQMSRAGAARVTCMDAQGRLVYQEKVAHDRAGNYNLNLDTGDWPVGVYYLRLQTGLETHTQKVIRLAD